MDCLARHTHKQTKKGRFYLNVFSHWIKENYEQNTKQSEISKGIEKDIIIKISYTYKAHFKSDLGLELSGSIW
jgi:hypothetical protein